MAKFPTYEEMAQEVAQRALDEYEYEGKTLREWIEIIKAQHGADLISRQQAIDALRNYLVGKNVPCDGTLTCRLIENEVINKLPSAESESFEWCTDCKEYDQEAHCCHRFSKMIRKTIEEMQIVHCIDCQHSEYDSVYGERWCHYNGKAEVVDDYHFCSCAERRKDG